MDSAIELAALALQCLFLLFKSYNLYFDLFLIAEVGDFDPAVHNSTTISEFRFLPEDRQTSELELGILEAFKKTKGLNPAQAESRYLSKAKYLESTYTFYFPH